MKSAILFALLAIVPGLAAAQEPMPMPMPMSQEHGHQHQMGMSENPLGLEHTRDGSGTSWLPDTSPMQGIMRHRGPWMLMAHGNAFLQYIDVPTDRGDRQFGSINWLMGMAGRPAAGGQVTLRGMISLEPLTVGRCGYPALLQSGEFCRGTALHDRQHPHDMFMEIAVQYRRAIGDRVALEVYGGPAAEPALGPTAYAHRPSAMPNPIAGISHHWIDSSHVSFGVVTAGLYGRKWKAEGSIFNGREPDDSRYDLDLAALDSYSGRVWFMPAPSVVVQVSAGHLKEAEFRASGPRADVDRVTASATYHRVVDGRLWATTVAWGRNREPNHVASLVHGDADATSAFIAETAADLTARDTLFARGEVVGKTTTELVLPISADIVFNVGKLQAGYTRWLGTARGMKVGVGGSVGLSFVPLTLEPFYGSRTAGEFSLFFTIRPQDGQ